MTRSITVYFDDHEFKALKKLKKEQKKKNWKVFILQLLPKEEANDNPD